MRIQTIATPELQTSRSPRILVVEDDPCLSELCHFMLEMHGFEVETENFGQRVLATARGFQPEIILLDMNLPGKSGREIAAELDEDDALSLIPIAFMTGGITRADAEEQNAAGGIPILPKPFTSGELAAFVNEVLAGAAAEDGAAAASFDRYSRVPSEPVMVPM